MNQRLFSLLKSEEQEPFEGWNFSYLKGRMLEDQPSWNYAAKVAEAMATSSSMLDMGTGGGEYLAQLDNLPLNTQATEGYGPNVPVARKRLEPRGIPVHEVRKDDQAPLPGESLPLSDGSFDLVINRHESYSSAEVFRVLRRGGWFITQQVGGTNCMDLNTLLEAPSPDFGLSYWNVAYARDQLIRAGFQVEQAREEFPLTRFADVGAVVYYLQAVPWQIPDFSVERYVERLEFLDRRIATGGPLRIRGHRFFNRSQKKNLQRIKR